MQKTKSALFGGKTIEEWHGLWVVIPGGLQGYQRALRRKVGVYRVLWRGQIVAIGTATDLIGGLAKRLSDFSRPSPSGRNHHAGRLIHEHLSELVVEVLITGSDDNAREIARDLKTPMIRRHRPIWTAPNAPFMRKER